jgi:hypothetical protein
MLTGLPRDSRQIERLTIDQRKEILYRAVPKMIKNFNFDHCSFEDLGIKCYKCPLSLNGGQHCDLRAILAVVIDDMEELKINTIPFIADEPFDEGTLVGSKPRPKIILNPTLNRFEKIG